MKLTILFIGLFYISACTSSLVVEVEVYDGVIPVSTAEVRQQVKNILLTPIFNITARRIKKDEILKSIKPLYKEAVRNELPAEFNSAKKLSIADDLWRSNGVGVGVILSEELDKLDPFADSVIVLASQLQLLLPVRGRQPLNENEADLYNKFNIALKVFNLKRGEFESKIAFTGISIQDENKLQLEVSRKTIELTSVGIATTGNVKGKYLGYPLFDPNISSIIKTGNKSDEDSLYNESHWVPFVTNEFKASGGDSKFVVVREGLVVFHPKSLDFDPTSVIGAGTAVTKLGLKIAAAMASGATGIPMPAATDSKSEKTSNQTLFNDAEIKSNQDLLTRRALAKTQFLEVISKLREDAANNGITIQELKKSIARQVGYYSSRTSVLE